MNISEKVTIVEVGPRDGFQLEKKLIPLDLKLDIISMLANSGIKQIQVASFVNSRLVPKMADAEELVRRLPCQNDITYFGLALNKKGVERAYNCGLECIEVSISSSDAHSRKNAGMSLEEALNQGVLMIKTARQYGMKIIASIQCAFGCVYEGHIPEKRVFDIATSFIDAGIDRLSLADTTGMANPLSVEKIVLPLMDQKIPVGLHLHDTRGLAMANILKGLELGVRYFDTAVGGMGGCPFVRGAAGNVATEDVVYFMESMNIKTGIDGKKVSECAVKLENFLGRELAGKVHKLSSCCF